MSKEKKKSEYEIRPPIVVVMGHIDHGKTKILDWYRKTKVVEQESGGITQHIGAYEVEHKGKRVTFIDTPGHEAFSKMRSRGARIADIAVLVVAADEGVKPQTKEAIEIIKENDLPFVVAINKIDKPEANVDRIKQQLAEEDILLESYGGKIPSAEISAKTGVNMDGLLELILLVAEIQELQGDPDAKATGVVIEAHRDSRRGVTTTLLVRDGTLKKQDVLVIGRSAETIKILEDFLGRKIEQADPSSPVLVAGLAQMPAVGDTFVSFASRGGAEKFITGLPLEEQEKARAATASSVERPVFNIILKSDVVGSQEVLEESLKKLESEKIGINIIHSEIGDINESDVKMAQATNLVTVIGFKVKTDASARELAEQANIRMVTGDVIYEVLDSVKEKMIEMIPPEIQRKDLGRIKILKIFSAKGGKEGRKQIVGGRVEDGVIKKGTSCEIKRVKEVVGAGTILQLQREKVQAEEVVKGAECGLLVDSTTAIQEGDVLEIYEEEIIKRTL